MEISWNREIGLDIYSWIERFVRASVDFAGVQAAGLVALAVGGIRLAGTPLLHSQYGEALLFSYYVHTFLPLSLLFPITNACFGLYTRSRGYTLQYKLRIATLSAVVAALAVVLLCFMLNRSASPSAITVLVFSFTVAATIPGFRWMKDWMFHRESESVPRVQAPAFE